MFKIHKGICICHNKPNIIVVKKGFCKRGNEEQKALKKKSKHVSPVKTKMKIGELRKLLVPKKKARVPSGELELFKKLWSERPHVCQVTGEPIREFEVSLFSHLLSKAAYNSLRLNPENIWIVTRQIHNEWHTMSLEDPKWDKKKEARDKLKYEYYNK